MRVEHGRLVFTDIFVRDLRERRTSLRLLPLTQSTGWSSFVRGLTGWVFHMNFMRSHAATQCKYASTQGARVIGALDTGGQSTTQPCHA